MLLRKLEVKDAPLMLEWMHDLSVTKYLQADFKKKTLQDCIDFINASQDETYNIHLAIVDEADTYMGTVSLKNVTEKDAEFAIAVRAGAMGKGYAAYGIKEIIRKGIEEKKLDSIYWCVSPNNHRAIRFYNKNGYKQVDNEEICVSHYSKQQINTYLWYREIKK